MSRDTKIGWCDSTVNGDMGCPGCELWNPKTGGTCYAASLVARYGGLNKEGKPNNKGYPLAFNKPQAWPDRVLEAAKWPDFRGKNRTEGKRHLDGMARHIFLSDMGDLFGPDFGDKDIPGLRPGQDWFDHVRETLIDVPTSEEGRRHKWIVLTKRASKLRMFVKAVCEQHHLPWPSNVYCGVSVTTQTTVKRIEILGKIRQHVPVLFASLEPLLTRIDCHALDPAILDWVILGGESGAKGRRMNQDWAREIKAHCIREYIPFFFKQWGHHGPPDGSIRLRASEGYNFLDGAQYLEMPRASREA